MAESGFECAVIDLITSLRERGMPSARNLLVTVFGDAIRPHGAAVSVASLTRILEPFAVNERLVRTSLTRLAAEELVAVTKVGHRSFYGVDPRADALFDQANDRIYPRAHRSWDGQWTLVVIDGNEGTASSRADLRRELAWLGLGMVAPNVLGSPLVEPAAVLEAVERSGHGGGVLVTRSATVDAAATLSDVELARRCAPLDELGERYEQLTCWLRPLHDALRLGAPSAGAALSARILLVALYRRVVLTDPVLPEELLPPAWSGRRARDMVAALYRTLHGPAETRLADVCETATGALAGVAALAGRFE